MNEAPEEIRNFLNRCSLEEREAIKRYVRTLTPHPLETDWGVDADTILTAIRRSSDLTKRGVRGIIAEAVFESSVLPQFLSTGWQATSILGDMSYDVELKNGSREVRIQIKLQRSERGVPKLYYPKRYPDQRLFVVEVQKTRNGQKRQGARQSTESGNVQMEFEKTRPYRFGDFDILAVNMHPSSGRWRDFRYTLCSWLIPRKTNSRLIEIMQPVSAIPNSSWTDQLTDCIEWLESGEKRDLL